MPPPWRAPLLFASVVVALSSLGSLSSETPPPLLCRPIGDQNPLPEICTSNSHREDLYHFGHLPEVYQRDQSTWLDRIELWPDLSSPQLVLGQKKTTLKVNAFLRPKDLKDILAQIHSRLRLIDHAPDAKQAWTQILSQSQWVRLNLEIPLKQFLDQPFIGWTLNETTEKQMTEKPMMASVVAAPSISENKAPSALEQPHQTPAAEVSGGCQKEMGELKEAQSRAQNLLAEFQPSLDRTKQISRLLPEILPLQPQSLSVLAMDVGISDCDLCGEALNWCLQNKPDAWKTTRPSLASKGSCRVVLTAKSCWESLPPRFLLNVETCRGTPPGDVAKLLERRKQLVQSDIAALDVALKTKEQECSRAEAP